MSQAKEVKPDRKYTKDHEWALSEGGELVIGITAFAVDALGDITLVSVDVKPGDHVEANKAFGTIESVKTLSDLYAPIDGKVVEVNNALDGSPELVNSDPYGEGWMFEVRVADAADVNALMDADAYRSSVD